MWHAYLPKEGKHEAMIPCLPGWRRESMPRQTGIQKRCFKLERVTYDPAPAAPAAAACCWAVAAAWDPE